MKHLIIFFSALLFSQILWARPVTLHFTNTHYTAGDIAIAVFDNADGFPNKGAILKTKFAINGKADTVSTTIDLADGHYAIAFFLDENGNSKLDKNIIGIPKERFGFSNNPRILTGPPSFNESEIEVSEDNSEFSMKLIKLL